MNVMNCFFLRIQLLTNYTTQKKNFPDDKSGILALEFIKQPEIRETRHAFLIDDRNVSVTDYNRRYPLPVLSNSMFDLLTKGLVRLRDQLRLRVGLLRQAATRL